MSDALPMEVNNMIANCIQVVRHVGSNEYANVCTGTSKTLAWGAGDWVLASTAGVLWLALMIVFVGFIAYGVVGFARGFVQGFKRGYSG